MINAENLRPSPVRVIIPIIIPITPAVDPTISDVFAASMSVSKNLFGVIL